MENASASAHRILELLFTKAVITGKAKSAIIKIPIEDLRQQYKNGTTKENVDFVVTFTCKWLERDEETQPIEIFEDENA